jgi:hypothetical protein
MTKPALFGSEISHPAPCSFMFQRTGLKNHPSTRCKFCNSLREITSLGQS